MVLVSPSIRSLAMTPPAMIAELPARAAATIAAVAVGNIVVAKPFQLAIDPSIRQRNARVGEQQLQGVNVATVVHPSRAFLFQLDP